MEDAVRVPALGTGALPVAVLDRFSFVARILGTCDLTARKSKNDDLGTLKTSERDACDDLGGKMCCLNIRHLPGVNVTLLCVFGQIYVTKMILQNMCKLHLV